MIHDFDTNLIFSEKQEGKLDSAYYQYFGTVKSIKTIQDKDRQHNGVDREVTLESGETIVVQEKWRTINPTGDILIEYCSVYQNYECKTQGWIYDIDSDYLFYVFGPTRDTLVYPVFQLKLAWKKYGEAWKMKYPIIKAKNYGYITLNVAVPCEVLEAAILETMHFRFQQPAAASA